MTVRHMTPEQVAPDIRRQMKYLTGAAELRRFHRKVVGPVMVTGAILRFLSGKGPEDVVWKSGSSNTQLGGRWSAKYQKRPSGAAVSADKVRNLDTTDLANSHSILDSSEKGVKVGPKASGKGGSARKIMEREAGYGNHAVGWDNRLLRVLDSEIRKYTSEIAEGKTPRYLPISRIRIRA